MKYPHWGGEKLSRYLLKNEICFLSPATLNRLKKRLQGEISEKKLHIPVKYEFINPNDAWSMDFLEFQWGVYTIYILTVLDDNSRYVLNWSITTNQTTEVAINLLQETFSLHGAPDLIKTDNGPPFREEFASFLEGFQIEHFPSPYYCPGYNGKTERQNKELRFAVNKAANAETLEECIYMIGYSFYEYNYIRPHEALKGVTPYEKFSGSEQEVSEKVRLFKEQEQRRRKRYSLFIPGQPDPQEPKRELILQEGFENKSTGIIVPVKSKNSPGKNVGCVSQTIHF